jgi:signal transduction histidine kinase
VLGLNFDQGRARSFVLTQGQFDELRRAMLLTPPGEGSPVAQIMRDIEGVPVRDLVGPMDKMVADLAARLGKTIAFELRGADVRVDHARVGPLFQVLPHLIRNAIDHGVEPSGERGTKPDVATVRLEIVETELNYVLAVQDDGRGINLVSVLRSAVERGIVTESAAALMTDAEVIDLIFRDNLSTATEVTDVSGRGVGMSAVKAEVRRLGGDIVVHTELGRGTRFELIVPKLGVRASHAPRRSSERFLPRRSERPAVDAPPESALRGGPALARQSAPPGR